MTKDSIDFQPLPQDTAIPVRHSFRVPVSSKDNVLAIFQGQTYAVANISGTGIAIHSESCLEFEAGQILKDSELWIGTNRLTGLTGEVIHCSVHASGKLQFGIVWQDLDDDTRAVLKEKIEKLKSEALEENSLPEQAP